MNYTRIPVWEIDVGDYNSQPESRTTHPPPGTVFDRLSLEDKVTFVRCYNREDGVRIPVADVARSARMGSVLFGVKGTRHVGVVGGKEEVLLEDLAPRIEWSMFE